MTDLQALLDATPDGETCVIPAGDHAVPEGTCLHVPYGVAAIDATGATIRVVGADGQRSTVRPTVPLFDCGQRPNGSTFTFRGGHLIGPDTYGWDVLDDVGVSAIQWSFYKTWDSVMTVDGVTVEGGYAYAVMRSGGGDLTITGSHLSGWVGAVACFEGHGGHGTFTASDCLFPAPQQSKYSSIGAYVHPHLDTIWTNVHLCGWNRYALYLNGSPSGVGSHHSLIDVTATDCSLIQGAKGSTVHLVRCVEQGTPHNGGSYMMGTVISHGSQWRHRIGMIGTQNDDIDFTFCGDTIATGQWWLGPGRNTTGSIRIIGCHVELSAQTRVVGAADSSPLDVTVMATEFVGSTTRQAFNVPAGAVRFIDCEAP